jgi:CRISPR/Cas system-associated exonuclease Cas4 (RecB family)
LHSLEDNKRCEIKIPKLKDQEEFKSFLLKMRNFDMDEQIKINEEKCRNCIYKELCH